LPEDKSAEMKKISRIERSQLPWPLINYNYKSEIEDFFVILGLICYQYGGWEQTEHAVKLRQSI
jgi:hypothetical protein